MIPCLHVGWDDWNCKLKQIAIHAIGDAANDRVLAIYQELNATNGQKKRRLRVWLC